MSLNSSKVSKSVPEFSKRQDHNRWPPRDKQAMQQGGICIGDGWRGETNLEEGPERRKEQIWR
jgi:hypothetical protein